jgi:hypothetical protein
MRQQTIKYFSYALVTLTRCFFETMTIQDPDGSSALVDQSLGLEPTEHRAQCGSLNGKQFGQELMGKRNNILVHPILHVQDPATAPLFDAMSGVARDNLEGSGKQCLAIPHDDLTNAGSRIPNLVDLLKGNA